MNITMEINSINMRYFIVTSIAFASVCAFSSVSVAQGANRVPASSRDFVNKQVSNFSDKDSSKKKLGIVDNNRKEVAEFAAVSWTPKKRGLRFLNRPNRLNLFFRGPMSF
ncbi:hypothetical protein [Bartonella refiksaydamii]|uniref:hypothetical protein n=1 Tax=Bartonella refiksaydamii TaxID=2654951 RepID=UPI001FED3BA7|nr:hypothetical protein [Bartonella refiksaydamii]